MSDINPEQEAKIAEFIHKLNTFSTGESRTCPLCGKEVTGARLYEKWEPEMYSLYALPCGCRQGLWSKAPAWIEHVEIVTLEDQEYEPEKRRLIAKEKERLARWNAAARGKAEGGQS